MTKPDPDEYARSLAATSLAGGDPTGWFERLYAAAESGAVDVPWDRGKPHVLLEDWAERQAPAEVGQRALVPGSGLGEDAELVARLGYRTVAFDVSASAVALARQRFPDSAVEYVTADLLDLPAYWRGAFDLVVECLTVQSLPKPRQPEAIAQVGRTVGPGGTLLVITTAAPDRRADPGQGPPWLLGRAEVESFATGDLQTVRIEELRDTVNPAVRRWRAEFHRS